MAGEVYDLSGNTYEDALKLCELVYDDPNASAEIDRLMTKWGRNKDWDTVISDWVNTPTQQEFQASLDKYRRYAGNGYVSPIKNQKGKTIAYETTQEASLTESLNSNSSPRATVRTPMQTNYEVVDNVPRTTFKTGVRETGKFVFGSVLPAVAGACTGISLGKKISQFAYDQGWDWGTNMASFDADVYEGLTTLDPLDQAVFKFLWGIDGDTTTAYMDDDAYAYIAMMLAHNHALDPKTPVADVSSVSATLKQPARMPTSLPFANNPTCRLRNTRDNDRYLYDVINNSQPVKGFVALTAGSTPQLIQVYVSTASFTVRRLYEQRGSYYNVNSQSTGTYHEIAFQISNTGGGVANQLEVIGGNMPIVQYPTTPSPDDWDIAYTLFNADVTTIGGVDGIDDQDGATQPDTTGWNDLDSTKQSLQNQYPDLWNNAKHYDYTDDDGNNKTKTYIPIPLPDNFSDNGRDPTSGNSSQDRTGNDITNIPKELIDLITQIINQIPSPNTPSDGTPTNAPPTGSGESPTVVTPTGRASSLWKIYNPSQAQLDSFGSWLWSSDFVDQIKKLFNDPMQGIIGVHKVFASPDIGGSATIKVGYLDSGVSSNWVSDQYTTVNCGTVSLREYFGNVFDYAPYTKVSLYLPFIGIVDLDVGDVMRASISVKYHVDVLTGACLADVKVDRDGCEAVLYQYSGSAIVTYPVSSGNYMGMVAGVLSVASGVAGTILSGGALAPALIGGAVGASHLHTDVSHSGGFSGCAGAMASKKPYLIISRPQTALAGNFAHFTGYPANSQVTLNNCSGYTKIKSVYVGNVQSATDEEKDMIEAQLKAGVLI